MLVASIEWAPWIVVSAVFPLPVLVLGWGGRLVHDRKSMRAQVSCLEMSTEEAGSIAHQALGVEVGMV